MSTRPQTSGCADPIMNTETTKTGNLRVVCWSCDKRSRPFDPHIAFGPTSWACAPYPESFEHRDGSTGRRWTCPACIKLRHQRQRDGVRPLLTPSPRRAEVIARFGNDRETIGR